MKVVNGRYGPCIQAGKLFFKIPKDTAPEDLTLEVCLKIAGLDEESLAKAKGGAKKGAKKAAPKKAAKKKAAAKKAAKKSSSLAKKE